MYLSRSVYKSFLLCVLLFSFVAVNAHTVKPENKISQVENTKTDGKDSKKKNKATKPKAKEAFVRTIVSKPSVSESDTLSITYRLYTNVEADNIIDVDFPVIRDFYSNNVTPSRQQFREEKYKGKTYKVIDIRVLILQPRGGVGVKEIPQGSVSIEYVTRTGRKTRDAWGRVFEEVIREEKTLPLEPVTIRVENLTAV